ncbi:hypothetical protein, variant 1 [Plasmopara halstedii]|uniref:Oxidation resistance protein 1 n=1 Tax=Plasmopara halstedii TaxID=4781 RepID=A0A0N7L380_PLAHL|nr:hypothetical protein, variant 1 [Plasmopara halstedii]CEG35131.1 hypothetical protein, variant 1 [Plasmopara halstedii]|eukprot:XP_024571500.1 hypothetical protein, variant 1 [Plasmopara halstedii]
MLSKISHWLASRHEDKIGTSDVFAQRRYDALTRLKNATLVVLRKENAADLNNIDEQQDDTSVVQLPREQRLQLTDRDPCVGELCVALEECLKLGLKCRSYEDEPCWWHVLYASTLIVDEQTLVQSVLSAAFLSETDVGKARCWLKIALNNHTIESSVMMIFSMACENLIRYNYEEWSLVRCSEGLGLFLELVIALRDVHFAIEVNGEPFYIPEQTSSSELELHVDGNNEDMVSAITDEDIAAAVGASLSKAEAFLPLVDSELVYEEAENVKDVEVEGVEIERTEDNEDEDEAVQLPSALFPHRLKGIKPSQYVFGVSLASLSKNPYHSRYASIDPFLAIPNIVDDCIKILWNHPDTSRLFRSTVLNIRLNQLREIVETEGSVPQDLDPQCAGALFLDFLRNLPDSVVTDDKYDAFVAAGQLHDEDASIRNITCLVNDLPVCCQIVLNRVISLMNFLQQPEHCEQNGIDVLTASTILAPVIAFRKDSGSGSPSERMRARTQSQYQDVRYAAVGAQVVERMIQHEAAIFQGVRVQIVDALERLEAKKEALRMVSHQLKLQPQMTFLSDRQHVNEITRLFRRHLKGDDIILPSSTDNVSTEYLKFEYATDRNKECQYSAAVTMEDAMRGLTSPRSPNATSGGASSPSVSETAEQDLVSIWEQFGFNKPTILGNFEKGGVLLLRAISYWLKNDANALTLLKMRALPSKLPSYDAGLVASSICESLVKNLKLFLSPKNPEVDIVALSLEPFWKLFDEDMYFNKLFMLMYQMFDQLWSDLDPKSASFTRVISETEGIVNELLKTGVITVNDLRAEWGKIRAARLRESKEEDRTVAEEDLVEEGRRESLVVLPHPDKSQLLSNSKVIEYNLDDYLLKLIDSSSILTADHIACIDHALPITTQLCRWYKIYSVEANGSSLETLLTLAKKQSPTLLVVKDAKGNVFGGFASDEWHRAFNYYGTGESFLFSFANTSAAGGFVKYQWSRKNSYFMLCSDESLIMGGGGNFGLFLDSDLSRGTSGACETFNSPPLTVSQEFSCVQVELWGFTTGDKPAELGYCNRKSVLD